MKNEGLKFRVEYAILKKLKNFAFLYKPFPAFKYFSNNRLDFLDESI